MNQEFNVQKFHVGDRVRLIEQYFDVPVGAKGVIKAVNQFNYSVEFDDAYSTCHNCDGDCRDKHGLWLCQIHLELIPNNVLNLSPEDVLMAFKHTYCGECETEDVNSSYCSGCFTNVVLDALRKQVPLYAAEKWRYIDDIGVTTYLCPQCQQEIAKGDHHCRCGQAIKWD